jgi:DNA-binding transcriptional regulator of glucitol operon
MLRRLLTPGWLALHVVALAGFLALVGLGRWQWHRALETHRFQNYSYAFEWWLFAAFAVFLWVKTMLDTLEEAAAPPEPAPVPVAPPPPPTQAEEDEDPELAAYNRRLAELHARDQAAG